MSKETITEFIVGERLDKALAQIYPEYSRAAIEKLIDSGEITVNNKTQRTRYKLKTGDKVQVDFTYLNKQASEISIQIIFEDKNIVVINKPVGILAHTKGAFSKEGTVASWLKMHYGDMQNEVEVHTNEVEDPSTGTHDDTSGDFWSSNRAGIVHRLDRGTSGVMIVAKNKETQDYLQGQFSKRNVKKTYLAIVSGELPEKNGLIDIPIERNPKKPATFRAGANGKPAQTEFKILAVNHFHITNHKSQTTSLVELKPITGRTHQLRVHLQHLGNPIIGDEFYGGEDYSRLLLHAKSLEVTLAGGERKIFEAPIPSEFVEFGKK